MDNNVIKVKHISKIYKLYDNPMDRLKEALKLTKKKKYTEYYALNDINFEVEKGSTVGLIGTNGAGKSTLLKIITGVLTPTSGEVEVQGKIAALLELGAGFNQEYTGIENIYLNGSMMGYTKEQMDERVNTITEFAGIGDFINQPVKTYSSGMFARLAFAVAINVDPDILIVDEALSVGDIYFQAKCFNKMNEIKAKGTTILLVTHDMGSVIKYCDKVVVLNKGNYLKEGKPKEMVDIYKKLLVNQYDDDDEIDEVIMESEDNQQEDKSNWKNQLKYSEEKLVYGNNKASIIDFGIFDHKGKLSNMLLKKKDFTIRMRVEFHEDVENPIFAFTIKNVHGSDITGTNTMFEKKDVPLARKGEIYEISFKQQMLLQGGEYLLSFGCTGFENGEFVVYHRLYDITNIAVISEQDTVGVFDIDSKVDVKLVSED
ncbi:MAG: ABC transporter ATP-binding protein [Lachnospiraceae bacterium]|nr:ABC transporter ATP-binding protein [Lachnospiraceae bacterium]